MLGDAEKRARFDRFGLAGVQGPGGGAPGFNEEIFTDFSDILGDFFGFGGGRRPGGPTRGSDLRFDLEDRLPGEVLRGRRDHDSDSARGELRHVPWIRRRAGLVARDVSAVPGPRAAAIPAGVPRRVADLRPVPRGRDRSSARRARHAAGRGHTVRDRRVKVRIPAGIADGQRLRLSGEGEHGIGRRPARHDLYVVIHVKPHEVFQREGDDLYVDVPVPFPTLTCSAAHSPWTDRPGPIEVNVSAGIGHRHARAVPRQGHAERLRDPGAARSTSGSSPTCRRNSPRNRRSSSPS